MLGEKGERIGNEVLWDSADKEVNCNFSIQASHQALGPRERWGNSIAPFYILAIKGSSLRQLANHLIILKKKSITKL